MLVEERKKCYEARDAYFSCLGANGGRRHRRSLRGLYEKHCPPSWVKHFDKKREEDEKLRKLLEARSDADTKAGDASNAGK
jgi:hypothetical protein